MSKSDLSSASIPELEAALAAAKKRQLVAAAAICKEAAASQGLTVAELMAAVASLTPKPAPAPEQSQAAAPNASPRKTTRRASGRNGRIRVGAKIDAAGIIWSGRGRHPKGFDASTAKQI